MACAHEKENNRGVEGEPTDRPGILHIEGYSMVITEGVRTINDGGCAFWCRECGSFGYYVIPETEASRVVWLKPAVKESTP
jgi:hypothetical protein